MVVPSTQMRWCQLDIRGIKERRRDVGRFASDRASRQPYRLGRSRMTRSIPIGKATSPIPSNMRLWTLKTARWQYTDFNVHLHRPVSNAITAEDWLWSWRAQVLISSNCPPAKGKSWSSTQLLRIKNYRRPFPYCRDLSGTCR